MPRFLTGLIVLAGTACGLQHAFGDSSRRNFLIATGSGLVLPTESKASTDARNPEETSLLLLSRQLLSSIPSIGSGAPATNATLPAEVSTRIEGIASLLEGRQSNNALSERLSGSWRLRYSNAPEIVGLAKGLPLGFVLGPTYQPLDTTQGFFENNARLDHAYGLATLATNVVGGVRQGKSGSVNAAGVINKENNRVEIRFEVIVFEVDALLGRPLEPPIRRALVPAVASSSGKVLPANDQTYLDERLRIVRGGDGSLFIFERAEGPPKMMTADERAGLLSSTSGFGSTQTPVGEDLKREERRTKDGDIAIPAEIRYLFRDRTR